MYEFYCSFIHFSHKALLTSILVQNESAIEISLSKDFTRFKEEVLENSESFIELSKFLLILLSQKMERYRFRKYIIMKTTRLMGNFCFIFKLFNFYPTTHQIHHKFSCHFLYH